MKKFKKNLKKLFAISVCTTLLTSLIFVNTNAAENNKSSKIAKSETIKSTTHLQNRSIKYRKGKRLSISGESSNSDIATYSTEANGTCGDNVTWELKDGILTISGNGTMDDFVIVKDGNTGQIIESESHPCPWENDKGKIKEVYIKDGVTKVGARAFSDCYSLTKVVIGNSVKSIGEYAFTNDDSLTDLTLGNSVETIEMDALYGISIKTLVLPSSIKNLTNYSLLALWDLENIEISGSNLYQSKDGILYADGGKTLFLYPAKRKGEYTIPSNVTKIAEDAFAYSNLTKIVVPDTVTELGDGAFEYNESLETLIFGKGATSIPYCCCYYDRGLKNVTIPEGITTIEDAAFWWCTSLESVTLPTSITKITRPFEKDTKVITQNKNLIRLEDGSFTIGFYVNVAAKEMYKNAFKVLELVNKERRKEGLSDLVMDQSLLETAMLRGFENVIYWSHTRPDGEECFSANSRMMGENIATGQTSPEQVMNAWMNSSGHRANILGSTYKSIGIGCVYIQGTYYWVQCFGTDVDTSVSSSAYTDKDNTRSVLVKKDKEYYNVEIELSSNNLNVGETADISVIWNRSCIKDSGLIIQSSNPSVCEVNGERLIAKNPGTADIIMYYNGYSEAAITKHVTVRAKINDTNSLKTTQKTKTSKTNKTTQKKIAKASIKKLKNKKSKKVIVQINKIKNVNGYQIVYANNKNFKKASTVMTTKTNCTIKKLKKKKTYYIKVRAYKKTASGKKTFGAYSKVMKIKISK